VTTQEAEVKSNDTLTVSVERQPGCHVKFTITVEPKAVAAAYVKALKNINKEVSIPGFRKGRAPDELIKDRFTAQIDEEMKDIVVQTAFGEALNLTQIYPLKREGSVKRPHLQKCSKSEGAQMTMEFETRPEVPSVDVNAIQLQKIDPRQVNQEMIDQALKNLCFHYCEWEEINDRPLQKGDFVDIDVDVLEEPQHQIMSNARVGVNEEQMPQWLLDLVIGMKSGESKEGVDPTPEKQVPLKVTVKAAFVGKMPAVDDELAKKLGLQTTEELMKKVTERLEQQAKLEKERLEFNALEQYLSEHYQFDLPETYIQGEAKGRVERHIQKLKDTHIPDEEIKKHLKEIQASIRQQAIHQLQNYFLFHQVATEQHIELTAEDVTQELSNQISLMATGESEVDFRSEDVRDHIQAIALQKKIKNYLLEKAVFI
jgi:trigger factor